MSKNLKLTMPRFKKLPIKKYFLISGEIVTKQSYKLQIITLPIINSCYCLTVSNLIS